MLKRFFRGHSISGHFLKPHLNIVRYWERCRGYLRIGEIRLGNSSIQCGPKPRTAVRRPAGRNANTMPSITKTSWPSLTCMPTSKLYDDVSANATNCRHGWKLGCWSGIRTIRETPWMYCMKRLTRLWWSDLVRDWSRVVGSSALGGPSIDD